MKNKIKIGLIVGICALMLACGNSGKSGKVVFETEDKKIKVYESEVNYELKRNLEATGLSEKDISAEQLEQMKIQIVKNIAMTRAIALEGKNQNLDKSKNYLDGIETTKESLLASVTVAERSKNTEVTEEKLREVYENSKSNYERKEDTVRLQIAILKSSDKAKAEEALKEALAKPDNFKDVVKKYSGANDGADGETGEIPLSTLASEYGAISSAIKNVSDGQVVNKVIIIGDELYIVKVLERLPKGYIEFSKVRKQIESKVLAEEKQEKSRNFVQEVNSKYKLDKITKENNAVISEKDAIDIIDNLTFNRL